MSTPAAKGNKLLQIMLIIGALLMVVTIKFGFIFIIIALLPSCVAYFIDPLPDKSAFKTVLFCNFSATLPYTIPLLKAGFMLQPVDIGPLITNPTVWLVIYSGAAAGWCLLYLCRFIARFFIIIYFDYQVSSLERFQKRLLDEWGNQLEQK